MNRYTFVSNFLLVLGVTLASFAVTYWVFVQ